MTCLLLNVVWWPLHSGIHASFLNDFLENVLQIPMKDAVFLRALAEHSLVDKLIYRLLLRVVLDRKDLSNHELLSLGAQ